MLVLRRRTDEGVVIATSKEAFEKGKYVRVMVTRIRENDVSLGFSAPQNMQIWRDEVLVNGGANVQHDDE